MTKRVRYSEILLSIVPENQASLGVTLCKKNDFLPIFCVTSKAKQNYFTLNIVFIYIRV